MGNLKRWHKITIGLVVIAVLGVVLGPQIWEWLHPAEKKATTELEERAKAAKTDAPVATDPPATPAPTAAQTTPTGETPAPSTETTAAPTTPATSAGASGIEGAWKTITTQDVKLMYAGYRVDEVLAGNNITATGRTSNVTGSLTVQGNKVISAEFAVDIASVKSDESRRDGQFRGNIMNAAQFPTANFKLTQPIEITAIPAEGETVTVKATGELTLRDKTNAVTFDITAFIANGQVNAAGEIPVKFADYGITPPDLGFVKTEDNGSVEFLLIFGR